MERPSLLVVDDDEQILSAVRRSLESTDFRVRTAGRAEEALALFAVSPAQVVLLPSWTSAKFVVGTEGTPYSFIVGSGTSVQAWDETTLGTTLSTLSSWPGMTVNMGSYVPTVMRFPGNAWDTLFVTDSGSGLYAIPGVGAPATGGTNDVLHTVADGFGGTMAFTGGLAQEVSIGKDGANPRPTFFSYQQNRIFAFDAQDAITVPPPPGSPPGTTAHIMADYPGGTGQRYWSSFTIGTSTGLMSGGAWESQGGDNQHRLSLKTQ